MVFEQAGSLMLKPSCSTFARSYVRAFVTNSSLQKKPLPPRPQLPDSELFAKFLKGSGPGGQKINKTNSAVQITHLPTGVVVKSQATRSRSQNHKIAREILAEKIELLQKGDESRTAKKIQLKSKRKASAAKKARRKYRKLEEGKNTIEGVLDEVAEEAEEPSSSTGERKDVAGT